jgi:hypothetical protein
MNMKIAPSAALSLGQPKYWLWLEVLVLGNVMNCRHNVMIATIDDNPGYIYHMVLVIGMLPLVGALLWLKAIVHVLVEKATGDNKLHGET